MSPKYTVIVVKTFEGENFRELGGRNNFVKKKKRTSSYLVDANHAPFADSPKIAKFAYPRRKFSATRYHLNTYVTHNMYICTFALYKKQKLN